MLKTTKWLEIRKTIKPESILIYEDKSEFNFINDKNAKYSFKKTSRNNSTTFQSQTQTNSKLFTVNGSLESPIKQNNLNSQTIKNNKKKRRISNLNLEKMYYNLFKDSTTRLPFIKKSNNNSIRIYQKKKTTPNLESNFEKNENIDIIRTERKNDTQKYKIGKLKYYDLIKRHSQKNFIPYENECEKCLIDYKKKKKIKLKILLGKMGDALDKFNMNDYKNMENTNLCEENIDKVKELVNIVKLKDSFNDLYELSEPIKVAEKTKFEKDYSRFKIIGNNQSKFLKTFFKPSTNRKFYSSIGAYFGS